MTPAALADLHALCFTAPRPWSASEFADLLRNPHVFSRFVPAGFVLGRVVADEAELLTLAVDPVQRGKGLGAQLVESFLSEAKARGAESAFLEVAENNASARRLYERHGFGLAGRRKGYYGKTTGQILDALVLVRPLTLP